MYEFAYFAGSVKHSKVFLDLLLEANDSGADFTEQDLRDEVHTFMFAVSQKNY